ncbi:hypothetical protein ACFQE1_18705, partial [Halobium palmae]
MSALRSSQRRLLGAALLAGVSIAVVFVAFSWSRLFLTNGSFDGAAGVVLGVLIEGTVATAWFVPFLLAVLIVLATPSRRTVAIGAALVYGVGLLSIVGRTLLGGVPVGIEPVVLAVPLASVANFLAVATAVWLAYHGGYERLAAAVGSLDRHPLL